MLPLGVSAVTVGFGMLLAFNRPPLDLRGSVVLVPLGHALVAVPLVLAVTIPVLRSLDQRLREVSATLGASPWRTWRTVDGRALGRALAVGAGSLPRCRWGSSGPPPSWRAPASPPCRWSSYACWDGRVRRTSAPPRPPRPCSWWSPPRSSWSQTGGGPTSQARYDRACGLRRSHRWADGRWRRRVLRAVRPPRRDRPHGRSDRGRGAAGSERVGQVLAPARGRRAPGAGLGTVSWDGVDLAATPTHRRGFGLVFQDALLFPHLDVAGNVAYGLAAGAPLGSSGRSESPSCSSSSSSPSTARGRSPRCRGEAQRVALARALALDRACSCSTSLSVPSTGTCATAWPATYEACSTSSARRRSMSPTTSRRPSWSPTGSCGSSRPPQGVRRSRRGRFDP